MTFGPLWSLCLRQDDQQSNLLSFETPLSSLRIGEAFSFWRRPILKMPEIAAAEAFLAGPPHQIRRD
jgi:hypothetical protein